MAVPSRYCEVPVDLPGLEIKFPGVRLLFTRFNDRVKLKMIADDT
eukprot:SAG11_NODE_182_length_13233_cov_59.525238_2_plen_45_part_00